MPMPLSPMPRMGCAPRWHIADNTSAGVTRAPRWLVFFLMIFALADPVCAVAADVEVLALFRDQAVIRVDGVRIKLKVGETAANGVRLVSADGSGAMLDIDGETRRYPLGSRIRSTYKEPESPEVQIFRDTHGMFHTVGSINGLPVNFLVDTGATSIAMNSAQARRLGIDYRVVGTPSAVMTASRVEQVYEIHLDSVKVGDILLRNVKAVVLEGPQPAELLLGMSYLGRLEMLNDGQRLVLRKKY